LKVAIIPQSGHCTADQRRHFFLGQVEFIEQFNCVDAFHDVTSVDFDIVKIKKPRMTCDGLSWLACF